MLGPALGQPMKTTPSSSSQRWVETALGGLLPLWHGSFFVTARCQLAGCSSGSPPLMQRMTGWHNPGLPPCPCLCADGPEARHGQPSGTACEAGGRPPHDCGCEQSWAEGLLQSLAQRERDAGNA